MKSYIFFWLMKKALEIFSHSKKNLVLLANFRWKCDVFLNMNNICRNTVTCPHFYICSNYALTIKMNRNFCVVFFEEPRSTFWLLMHRSLRVVYKSTLEWNEINVAVRLIEMLWIKITGASTVLAWTKYFSSKTFKIIETKTPISFRWNVVSSELTNDHLLCRDFNVVVWIESLTIQMLQKSCGFMHFNKLTVFFTVQSISRKKLYR